MHKRKFGELELSVLRVLKSGKKMTVKQVHSILGEENKYNTIMTVMSRLAEKGNLGREKVGLQYVYWLLPSETKVPSFIEQLKKSIFGIKTTEMISYLIDSAEDISQEEFAEMERLIANAKAKKNKT
jgi:predicted transcriptional regulator